jgi:hypothetical protein
MAQYMVGSLQTEGAVRKFVPVMSHVVGEQADSRLNRRSMSCWRNAGWGHKSNVEQAAFARISLAMPPVVLSDHISRVCAGSEDKYADKKSQESGVCCVVHRSHFFSPIRSRRRHCRADD